MFNQNIISNKFDLNWSTTFSYTGVQRFLQNPAPCTVFLRNRGIYIEDQKLTLSTYQKQRGTTLRNDAQNLRGKEECSLIWR